MAVSNFKKAEIKQRSIEKSSTKGLFRKILNGGILLNVILGFTYLLMLNSLATRGFDLETLKTEKLKIQKQIEDIEIALAIPTSLYALESNEQLQEMADVESKTFLEVMDDGRVAMVNW